MMLKFRDIKETCRRGVQDTCDAIKAGVRGLRDMSGEAGDSLREGVDDVFRRYLDRHPTLDRKLEQVEFCVEHVREAFDAGRSALDTCVEFQMSEADARGYAKTIDDGDTYDTGGLLRVVFRKTRMFESGRCVTLDSAAGKIIVECGPLLNIHITIKYQDGDDDEYDIDLLAGDHFPFVGPQGEPMRVIRIYDRDFNRFQIPDEDS